MAGVPLTQSGNLNLDVQSVSVSGQVRVNGQTMPDETTSRGTLLFTNEFGSVNSVNFSSTGQANYAITLVEDTYDILWNGNESLCNGSTDVPCNDGTVVSAMTLDSPGALEPPHGRGGLAVVEVAVGHEAEVTQQLPRGAAEEVLVLELRQQGGERGPGLFLDLLAPEFDQRMARGRNGNAGDALAQDQPQRLGDRGIGLVGDLRKILAEQPVFQHFMDIARHAGHANRP